MKKTASKTSVVIKPPTKKVYFCHLDYMATGEGHTVDFGLVIEKSKESARKIMSANGFPHEYYDCIESTVENREPIAAILSNYFALKHVKQMVEDIPQRQGDGYKYLYWGGDHPPVVWRYKFHVNRA